VTADSLLGTIAKNFLNTPVIKQGIQKKIADNSEECACLAKT
jgi:hypothetical protein